MTVKPLAVYSGKKVVFEVYRAKDLFKDSWVSSKLRSLVIAARKSYDRYGERPPLDRCDKKAAVYLVRARYRAEGSRAEEWLSVRMVPGDGPFFGVKEPEIFYYKGKPMDYWLRKYISAASKADFWKQVASSSRMCGIHPFYKRRQGSNLREKHKYTAACFAIIHAQFLIDHPLKSFPYKYITATIRPDLMRKGLAVKMKGKMVFPFFLPAYKLLGILRSRIGVDRKVYAYDFPSYWLNAKHMKSVVGDLIKKGLITDKTYLLAPFKIISDLQKKLTIKRKELFKIIDEKVDDATELKITPAKQWYRGIGKVLHAAGVKVPEFLAALKEL